MATFDVVCPSCESVLECEDRHAGSILSCPECETSITVPTMARPLGKPTREIKTNVKQTAIIGAAVCSLIGVIVILLPIPFVSSVLGGLFILISLILSVVAMTQGRVGAGIGLLVFNILGVPIIWFIQFFAYGAIALGGIADATIDLPPSTDAPSKTSAPVTPPPRTTPSDKPKPALVPISSLTWNEIDKIYNIKNNYSRLQKDELWKKYKGKKVKWTGKVSEIAETFGSLTLQIKMNDETFTSDLIITLNKNQRANALKLMQDDTVTFTGILSSWGSILPISLNKGEILSYTRP